MKSANNPEELNISSLDTQKEKIINDLNIFKESDQKTLEKLTTSSKLVSFKIGQVISSNEIIGKNIYIIIEGLARLLIHYKGKDQTLAKLSNQTLIGLASLLRMSPCEEVTASTNLIALSIPINIIEELYSEDEKFNTFCRRNIFPCEIAELAQSLTKKSPRSDISIRAAFNILVKNTQLISVNNESNFISKKVDNCLWSGSNNIEDYPIGKIFEQNENIRLFNDKFDARILSFSNKIYEEFMKKNVENQENSSQSKTQNPQIDNKQISLAPAFPEKSDVSFEDINSPQKTKLILAKGLLAESIACIQMLTFELEMPFRKDSVEKLLRDELRRKKQLNIESLGSITTMLGLYSWGKTIQAKDCSRLITPCIIPWENSFILVKESSSNGIKAASPKEGNISISIEEIDKEFPEGIIVLFVEKSNLTPNKKFNLEWFLPSIKKYRSSLILVLIASFVVQLFGLANPLLIQVIIDKVISQRSLDTLQILGFALIVVTILGGFLGGLRTFLFTETTNKIDTRLGAEVIDHLLRLPLNYFDQRPVGELGSRVSELEKIRNFLTGQALTTILDASFSIIYIVVMVLYSWKLTFIALAVIPIQTIITLLGSPLLRRQIREVAKQNAYTQSHLVEVLTGVQTVKAQNIETVSRWKWQNLYTKYISKTFSKVITTTALSQLSTVLQQLSQLMVLWIGAELVLQGNLTLGQLIAFRIISGYVTQPILRLSSIWQNIQELKVSFERLADIIDTPEESNESDKNNIGLPEIKGHIQFENVSFSFQKHTKNVLRQINFTVEQGKFIGIAGESGSGKSTLMKLLSRLYDASKGRILIDGYDINKVELYSLRRQIGIVPQDPLLFSGTVSENIAITNPDIGSDEIVKAAKIANAHEFIMELPQGYSTFVGERGSSLSGGQRQRIAIARTILNNPKLIIMDEATSALDYQTESKVCENLRQSCQGSTVFFITHRLNTIRNSDSIIMMDKGCIDEIGNHQDLIAKEGRYYALFKQQESN